MLRYESCIGCYWGVVLRVSDTKVPYLSSNEVEMLTHLSQKTTNIVFLYDEPIKFNKKQITHLLDLNEEARKRA